MPGVRHAFIVEGTADPEGPHARGRDRRRFVLAGADGAEEAAGAVGRRADRAAEQRRVCAARARTVEAAAGQHAAHRRQRRHGAAVGGESRRRRRTRIRSSRTRRSNPRTRSRISATGSSRCGRQARRRRTGARRWRPRSAFRRVNSTICNHRHTHFAACSARFRHREKLRNANSGYTRVVQIDPGPIPTFTASAPASIKALAPSEVATLPPTISTRSPNFFLMQPTVSRTPLECPCALSTNRTSTPASTKRTARLHTFTPHRLLRLR